MTLIITILTPRGVVLAADRRTLATDNKTGRAFVQSDVSQKIVIGPQLAVAVVGGSQSQDGNPRDVIERWIQATYKPDADFQQQAAQLYDSQFASGERGGFVAVKYEAGRAEAFRTRIEGEPEYDIIEEASAKARMKFNGSGNTIAAAIVDLGRPPLAAFDVAEAADYAAFLIRTTHGVQRYGKTGESSVGEAVTMAVIDYRGAQMVHGGDYQIDTPHP